LTGRPVAPPSDVRSPDRSRFGAVDPSRMVHLAALLIGLYAVFVATVPLLIYDEIRPPWALSRPIALVVLFAVPALLAVIGARTNVRAFVVVGGVLCLLQSAISFSGITIGFIVPALMLLVAGTSERWPDSRGNDPPSMVAGVASLGLVVGAWIAFLTLTEEVCWYASRAADGSLVFHRTAVTEVMMVPPDQVAGGCDGGTLTFEALAVGAILAIGAVAIAIMTGTRRVAPRGDL